MLLLSLVTMTVVYNVECPINEFVYHIIIVDNIAPSSIIAPTNEDICHLDIIASVVDKADIVFVIHFILVVMGLSLYL